MVMYMFIELLQATTCSTHFEKKPVQILVDNLTHTEVDFVFSHGGATVFSKLDGTPPSGKEYCKMIKIWRFKLVDLAGT